MKKILALIQGPVEATTHDLIKTLKSGRPIEKVILSHYDSEKEIGDPEVIDIRIKDPGGDQVDPGFRVTNIRRMLDTTYSCSDADLGGCDLILKLRSDLVIHSDVCFWKSIEAALTWFNRNPHAEVFCLQNGTFNPFSRYPFPFHLNDWLYLSTVEKYMSVRDFLTGHGLSRFLSGGLDSLPGKPKLKNFQSRYQAEQLVHFVDRLESYGVSYGWDLNAVSASSFVDYASCALMVVPLKRSGVCLSKRQKGIGFSHTLVTLSPFDINLLRQLPQRLKIPYLRVRGGVGKALWHPCNLLLDRIAKKLGLID